MSGAGQVIAVRVQIFGRVQGVAYRAWTIEQARALGLHGWVRNRLDGQVEAIFKGPADLVDEMISRCHQGPPAAKVERIEREAAQGLVVDGFTRKPTV